MLNKSKMALIAALVAGPATAALAQGFDGNPANRYPHYAGANASAHYMGQTMGSGAATTTRPVQSAPVSLRQRREIAPPQYR